MLTTDDRRDLPVANGERRQQVGRAVAHVLELPAGRPTGRHRLARGGRAAHADAGLLVDAEGRAVGRRVQLQLNHLDGLADEVGIALLHPGVKAAPGGSRPPGGSCPPCSCSGARRPAPDAHSRTAPDRAPTSASGPTGPARPATGTPPPGSGPAARRCTRAAAGDAGGPPAPPADRRRSGLATAGRYAGRSPAPRRCRCSALPPLPATRSGPAAPPAGCSSAPGPVAPPPVVLRSSTRSASHADSSDYSLLDPITGLPRSVRRRRPYGRNSAGRSTSASWRGGTSFPGCSI